MDFGIWHWAFRLRSRTRSRLQSAHHKAIRRWTLFGSLLIGERETRSAAHSHTFGSKEWCCGSWIAPYRISNNAYAFGVWLAWRSNPFSCSFMLLRWDGIVQSISIALDLRLSPGDSPQRGTSLFNEPLSRVSIPVFSPILLPSSRAQAENAQKGLTSISSLLNRSETRRRRTIMTENYIEFHWFYGFPFSVCLFVFSKWHLCADGPTCITHSACCTLLSALPISGMLSFIGRIEMSRFAVHL